MISLIRDLHLDSSLRALVKIIIGPNRPITKETQMERTPTQRSSVSPPKANDKAPKILDLPIGLDATGMRREFDSLGEVEVPANRYWGAQTQRSLEHFNIGNDRMPKEGYHAYGYVKKAAAVVNTPAGRLPRWEGQTIPALRRLRDATEQNARKWADVVKIGRTHLEDAVPLTVGQEWSGYTGALDDAIAEAGHATHGLLRVAMGGTAVGTGLNAPAGF